MAGVSAEAITVHSTSWQPLPGAASSHVCKQLWLKDLFGVMLLLKLHDLGP
jgi:hypothetical protein